MEFQVDEWNYEITKKENNYVASNADMILVNVLFGLLCDCYKCILEHLTSFKEIATFMWVQNLVMNIVASTVNYITSKKTNSCGGQFHQAFKQKVMIDEFLC